MLQDDLFVPVTASGAGSADAPAVWSAPGHVRVCVGAVFEVWPGGISGTSRASQIPCKFRRAVTLPRAAELVIPDYFMATSLSVDRKAKSPASSLTAGLLNSSAHATGSLRDPAAS